MFQIPSSHRFQGAWEEVWEQQVLADAGADVERAVTEAESYEVLDPDELFTGMYAEPTAELARQRRQLLSDLGEA